MNLDTNESIAKRADVPVGDVQYMPVGNEIFLRRSEKPIFTRRYDTLSDSLYRAVMGLKR